jgi:hypothetical protein
LKNLHVSELRVFKERRVTLNSDRQQNNPPFFDRIRTDLDVTKRLASHGYAHGCAKLCDQGSAWTLAAGKTNEQACQAAAETAMKTIAAFMMVMFSRTGL